MPLAPRALLIALLLSLLGACAHGPARLPESVRQALAAQGLPEDSLAVQAFPLHARQQGLRLQPQRAMAPGSTMKLVTAAVALQQLGPNARAHTELRALARPDADGVLSGPLYVRGGGSADLGYTELQGLLRELREAGVHELRGGVVLDRSLFQPERSDIGLPPFDETPEFPYNVIPDALQLGGSLQRLALEADASGRIQARLWPDFAQITLDASALQRAARPCQDWEDGWRLPLVQTGPDGHSRVQLQGEFPPDCRVSQPLQLADRQLLWEQALRRFWAEQGGLWPAGAALQNGRTPPETLLLARHSERPLAELLRGLMKRSDNAQTRLLYLRLGAAVAQPGEATAQAAARAVRDWFTQRAIGTEGLVLDNGSGLSRSERISAAQLAALLTAVWDEGRHLPELLTSLPVAGEDGTLSRRLKGTPAAGRARLKTGTLRDAVGLAGYVWDAQNRPWVMVGLLNHEQAPEKGRAVLDALAAWVAAQ